MLEVKEERITNAEVRGRLFNIPTIQNQIEKCQLTFIGKVVRNSDLQLPTKLLLAWCNHKSKRGDVLHSNKRSIVQHLELILPCIGKTGRMSEWVHFALENGYWRFLISNLGNSPKPRPAQVPSPSSSRNEKRKYFPPNSSYGNQDSFPYTPSTMPRPRTQAKMSPKNHPHQHHRSESPLYPFPHSPSLQGRDSILTREE